MNSDLLKQQNHVANDLSAKAQDNGKMEFGKDVCLLIVQHIYEKTKSLQIEFQGCGGFSIVVKLKHQDIHKGIKIIFTHKNEGPKPIEDQEREVKIQSSIHHPQIAAINEVSYCKIDLYTLTFIWMEFYQNSLKTYLDERRQQKEELDPMNKIKFAIQIFDSLTQIHAQQVLHRDIKGANILMKGDSCFISDFGVSKLIIGTSNAHTVQGTKIFQSPEIQIGKQSQLCDLFAAGIVMLMLDNVLNFCYESSKFDIEFVKKVYYEGFFKNKIPEELKKRINTNTIFYRIAEYLITQQRVQHTSKECLMLLVKVEEGMKTQGRTKIYSPPVYSVIREQNEDEQSEITDEDGHEYTFVNATQLDRETKSLSNSFVQSFERLNSRRSYDYNSSGRDNNSVLLPNGNESNELEISNVNGSTVNNNINNFFGNIGEYQPDKTKKQTYEDAFQSYKNKSNDQQIGNSNSNSKLGQQGQQNGQGIVDVSGQTHNNQINNFFLNLGDFETNKINKQTYEQELSQLQDKNKSINQDNNQQYGNSIGGAKTIINQMQNQQENPQNTSLSGMSSQNKGNLNLNQGFTGNSQKYPVQQQANYENPYEGKGKKDTSFSSAFNFYENKNDSKPNKNQDQSSQNLENRSQYDNSIPRCSDMMNGFGQRSIPINSLSDISNQQNSFRHQPFDNEEDSLSIISMPSNFEIKDEEIIKFEGGIKEFALKMMKYTNSGYYIQKGVSYKFINNNQNPQSLPDIKTMLTSISGYFNSIEKRIYLLEFDFSELEELSITQIEQLTTFLSSKQLEAVRILNLQLSATADSKYFDQIISPLKLLTSIEHLSLSFLQFEKIQNQSIKLLTGYCKQMKNLQSFRFNLQDSTQLKDDSLVYLGELISSLPHLSELKLSFQFMSNFSDFAIQELLLNKNLLKFELQLPHCNKITNGAFVSLANNLSICTKLQSFKLKSLQKNENIDNDSIQELLKNLGKCKDLRVFNMQFMRLNSLGDLALQKLSTFINSNPKLEELVLNFGNNTTFTGRGFMELVNSLSNLKGLKKMKLNFEEDMSFSDAHLVQLARNIINQKDLRTLYLDFSSNRSLQSNGLSEIATSLSQLKVLQKLSLLFRNLQSTYSIVQLLQQSLGQLDLQKLDLDLRGCLINLKQIQEFNDEAKIQQIPDNSKSIQF